MKISYLADLDKLESQIEKAFEKLKLGDVLHSLYLLRKRSPELRPFMVAGVSLFAARFCPPSKISAASHRNFAVNRDYFKKTCKQGVNIPSD